MTDAKKNEGRPSTTNTFISGWGEPTDTESFELFDGPGPYLLDDPPAPNGMPNNNVGFTDDTSSFESYFANGESESASDPALFDMLKQQQPEPTSRMSQQQRAPQQGNIPSQEVPYLQQARYLRAQMNAPHMMPQQPNMMMNNLNMGMHKPTSTTTTSQSAQGINPVASENPPQDNRLAQLLSAWMTEKGIELPSSKKRKQGGDPSTPSTPSTPQQPQSPPHTPHPPQMTPMTPQQMTPQQMVPQMTPQMNPQMGHMIGQMSPQMVSQIASQLGPTAMSASMRAAMQAQMNSQMSPQMSSQMSPQIPSQVHTMSPQIPSQISPQLSDRLSQSAHSQPMSPQIPSQYSPQISQKRGSYVMANASPFMHGQPSHIGMNGPVVQRAPSPPHTSHLSQIPTYAPPMQVSQFPSSSSPSTARPVTPPFNFDVSLAKAKLVDLVCGEKDMDKFCGKATTFICQYLNLSVGGFYMNERQNLKDWTMYFAYPSLPIFSAFFHFNVGYTLIMQAAVEKKCFSVNSTTANNDLCFLFVPIPSENGNTLGVMVLGSSVKGDVEAQNYLAFLEQIRKPLSTALTSLRCMQQNLALLDKLDLLVRENELYRQRNRFDKALIGVLSSITASDVSIICTDIRGTITYFSPGAQNMLGYQPSEVVGVHTPLKIHQPKEIDERAKQLEVELGKKVTGFGVFIENPQRTGLEETRKWTYIKKDGSAIKVSLSVKPIYDDMRIIGFVGIAKETSNGQPQNAT